MRKPIVVGSDPRNDAWPPIDVGAAIAKITGAPMIVACVEAGSPVLPIYAGSTLPYAIVHDDLMGDCSSAVEQIDAEMRAAGVPVDARTVRSTSAARALHELAEEEHAALLVVGATKRTGADRMFAGSTSESLLHGAPCPVAIVPPEYRAPAELSAIGVAYVATDEGRLALRNAHALARRAGATLRLITVVKGGDDGGALRGADAEAAERELAAAGAELGSGGDEVRIDVEVLSGDPADALARASRKLDLLVCGSRGYGPLRAVILGSVSRRLAEDAHCPVVVVPRGVEASLEELGREVAAAAA
jgi:nucleotide-binding universal stress UspA family protein